VENKLGRFIDKGGYGSEEMGFLQLFILLSGSNSQVILAARCHGITSHASQKGQRLYNMG
jgi:hypothetical protein